MSQGKNQSYPIQQFLNRLVQEFGPSLDEFVVRLGYRRIERGRHRLGLWLSDAKGYGRIINQIKDKFPDRAAELDEAIAETRRIREAEWEAAFLEACKAEQETFRPFVHVTGETTVPNGICIFGMTGGFERWNTVRVPESVWNLPIEEQLAVLPDLMRAYLKAYKGQCPFFGAVTGFKFCRCLDYFQFDKDGNFVEHVERPYRRGHVELSLR